MSDPIDKGNPNFFTTFKGMFEMVPGEGVVLTKDVVMLSCVNDVQILGDATITNYTAETLLATLPQECLPGTTVKTTVVINNGAADYAEVMTIDIDGSITLPVDIAEGKAYFSGMSFNISDKFY